MRRRYSRYALLCILPFFLLITNCKALWNPPLKNEYAVRETRERFPLSGAAVFRGMETGTGEFMIPIGFGGPDMRVMKYPPGGIGPMLLLNISSDNERSVKPGMYTFNSNSEEYVEKSFIQPVFYLKYNLNDFEPVIGSGMLDCIGGSINIYSWTETEMKISWAFEVSGETDTGGQSLSTGEMYTVDGRYNGPFTFYDFPVSTEHKGYQVNGVFYPLDIATASPVINLDGLFEIPIEIAGPDAESGIDSRILFRLILDGRELPDTMTYEFNSERYEENTCREFRVTEEFDFINRKAQPGAIIYQPLSGFCKILHHGDSYYDIRWNFEVTENRFENDKLTQTGFSTGLCGAYSGLIRFIE